MGGPPSNGNGPAPTPPHITPSLSLFLSAHPSLLFRWIFPSGQITANPLPFFPFFSDRSTGLRLLLQPQRAWRTGPVRTRVVLGSFPTHNLSWCQTPSANAGDASADPLAWRRPPRPPPRPRPPTPVSSLCSFPRKWSCFTCGSMLPTVGPFVQKEVFSLCRKHQMKLKNKCAGCSRPLHSNNSHPVQRCNQCDGMLGTMLCHHSDP